MIVFEETSRRGLYYRLPQGLALSARGIPGVTYDGERLRFDRSVHTEETAALLVGRLKGAQLRVGFQRRGQRISITADDLEAINAHSQVTLAADDVVVFQDFAANDALMRRPMRFTERALHRFAESFSEGRTVNLYHEMQRALGFTYAADVVEETVRGTEAHWLRVRWYAVTKGASAERLQAIQDAQTILPHMSIEFTFGKWTFQELEHEGGTLYFYEIDDDPDAHPRLEATATARVDLGAVYGAGDNKTKNQADRPGKEHDSPGDGRHSQKEEALCIW